jgi:hypothetical protein
MSRGILIAIEGADGSGKSRQAQTLAARLHARAIAASLLTRSRTGAPLLTAEPTGGHGATSTPIGWLIRRVLRGGAEIRDARALQLLFAADRLEHVAAEIEPALARGEVVVTDRYDLSGLVYLAAETPEGRCKLCGWSGDVAGPAGRSASRSRSAGAAARCASGPGLTPWRGCAPSASTPRAPPSPWCSTCPPRSARLAGSLAAAPPSASSGLPSRPEPAPSTRAPGSCSRPAIA